MEDFKIILSLYEADEAVEMTVKASSWEAADALSRALAARMPSKTVYFQKSNRHGISYWSGRTEEVE